jgi:hypothetical protein
MQWGRIMPNDRVPVSLYDHAFDAWATGQAASLREAGGAVLGRTDQVEHRRQALDWENWFPE